MTKIHARRLLKLAKFLREVVSKLPRTRFSMVDYGHSMNHKRLPWSFRILPTPNCQTAGCALGWATTIFRDLKMEVNRDEYTAVVVHTPTRLISDAAAKKFFGVEVGEDFNHVFGGEYHRTAKQESRIIDEWVKNQERRKQ